MEKANKTKVGKMTGIYRDNQLVGIIAFDFGCKHSIVFTCEKANAETIAGFIDGPEFGEKVERKEEE